MSYHIYIYYSYWLEGHTALVGRRARQGFQTHSPPSLPQSPMSGRSQD